LTVPLAIAYRRFTLPWCLPLLFWIWPFQETGGDAWKIALGLMIVFAVTASTMLSREPQYT
jgi:hypothetical protein